MSLAEPSNQSKCLLISAFGINSGGGLVLFKALVAGAQSRIRAIAIDARIDAGQLGISRDQTFATVRRSFIARALSSIRLARHAKRGEVLFCFNSLPPLVRSRAKVVTYVHAPHFVGAHRAIRYTPVTRVRIWVERLWFRYAIRHTDEAWVQTPTMAMQLEAQYPGVTTKIVPLVDEALATLLGKRQQGAKPAAPSADFSFFYPADTVGHKNHPNLLRAWATLAGNGCLPQLWLTVDESELASLLAEAGVLRRDAGNIVPLGRLSREAVLARLQAASALIFPSMAETFGLPMLEAEALNRPIVASERDFVRDVCRPVQTFDPQSPRSIAGAVGRFIDGDAAAMGPYFSAEQLVDKLLS